MESDENLKITPRKLLKSIKSVLKQKKSVLLLGPRQTGKSTLIKEFEANLFINFLLPSERLRYEKYPETLIQEIESVSSARKIPLVILDEVQKVPALLDIVQYAIDEKKAQFILSGSSARKLKKGRDVNLLPGRAIYLHLDPLTQQEYAQSIEEHLLFGSLPELAIRISSQKEKEQYLTSYVNTYLEEEVRQEALVRNLGSFARFLELAALESGNLVSYRNIANELGPTHVTISSYYEILQDCLIIERVDPIIKSTTRKKLTKSSKFLFFDLGVRRVAAGEGYKLSKRRLGELFEQFIGIELVRYLRMDNVQSQLKFWRDHDGPEVDWVIDREKEYIPIEVKWTDKPTAKDVKHLNTFISEYKEAKKGFVVCRTPRPLKLEKNITAISWKDLRSVIS